MNSFYNTSQLLKHALKRDRLVILFWVLGMSVFASGLVGAFVAIAQGDALVGMFEIFKNPAMIAMLGTSFIQEAQAYHIGAFYSHMMLLFSVVIAMIIAFLHETFHATQVEIVQSSAIGRLSDIFALFLEHLMIQCLFFLISTGLLLVFKVPEMDLWGSILYSASMSMAGMIGALLGILCAQVMPDNTSSVSLGLTTILSLYILRGISDVMMPSLSSLNPLSWFIYVFPYTNNNPMYLMYLTILLLGLVLLAVKIEIDREYGSSVFKVRQENPKAKSLTSLFAFLWQTQKSMIFAWIIGLSVLGMSYGSIYQDMGAFIESSPMMEVMFAQTGVSLEVSFTQMLMLIMVTMSAILPISMVHRLSIMEDKGQLDILLSTALTRQTIFLGQIAFASLNLLIAIFASTMALGLSAVLVMENSILSLLDFLKMAYNLMPAVLFIVAIAALLVSYKRRFRYMSYVYLIFTILLNYFRGILDIPGWILNTMPQNYVSNIPVESFEMMPLLVLLTLSMILMGLASYHFDARDLQD